jgi:hypothetical protein
MVTGTDPEEGEPCVVALQQCVPEAHAGHARDHRRRTRLGDKAQHLTPGGVGRPFRHCGSQYDRGLSLRGIRRITAAV